MFWACILHTSAPIPAMALPNTVDAASWYRTVHNTVMDLLPASEHPLVIRTNFSDNLAWTRVCHDIQKPVYNPDLRISFFANVGFLDNSQYRNLNSERVFELLPEGYNHDFLFLADSLTMEHSEHPLLLVYFDHRLSSDEPEDKEEIIQEVKTLRVIPSCMWNVENNLSLLNLDFDDYSALAPETLVDGNKVYRG